MCHGAPSSPPRLQEGVRVPAIRETTPRPRGSLEGHTRMVSYAPLLIVGYLVATVGALLPARDMLLRLLGAVVAAGAMVCLLLWRLESVSTWCAFAAVASALLLVRALRTDAVPTS
ncbi:DUF6629 family protein [Streptomyces sp. NPDC045431]|uniref:DUF6629 family protein n=1 Tax=Streptomyces sp. NPDC045431 TaxID=3155613 RepID=UPI0033D86539